MARFGGFGLRAETGAIPQLGLRGLLVALGGAAGVALRGLAEQGFAAADLPGWEAVMLCNLLGSFLIGVCFSALDPRFPQILDASLLPEDLPDITPRQRLLASFTMTGVLGGLTTFSSFSLDTVALIESSRFFEAGVSAAGSLLLGLAALFLGATLHHRCSASRHRSNVPS